GGLTVLDTARGTRSTVRLAKGPHLAAVNFLRVSHDRRTWYITGADINAVNNHQVAATWAVDARSRRVRWVAHGPLGATASPVQSSPDDRLVAVGYSQGATDVLDAATGRLVVRDASSAGIGAGDMAFPPGDKSLVTVALDGVIRTWSARGSERLRLQAPPAPSPHAIRPASRPRHNCGGSPTYGQGRPAIGYGRSRDGRAARSRA